MDPRRSQGNGKICTRIFRGLRQIYFLQWNENPYKMLPHDILERIFLQLSEFDLQCTRSTSREWYTIINSDAFDCNYAIASSMDKNALRVCVSRVLKDPPKYPFILEAIHLAYFQKKNRCAFGIEFSSSDFVSLWRMQDEENRRKGFTKTFVDYVRDPLVKQYWTVFLNET